MQRHCGQPIGIMSVAVDSSATTSIWPSSQECVTQWTHSGGYGEQLRVATEPVFSSSVKLNVPFSGSSKLGQSGPDGLGDGGGAGAEHAAQLHTGGVVSTPVAGSTHLIK